MNPGDVVPVTVTYLQMLKAPAEPAPPAPAGVVARQVPEPTVALYRRLYDAVGHDWYWTDRKRMPDGELADLLADPGVELHVLYVEGQEAGFAELDRRDPQDVRLVYFGLMPGVIGRGLGRWFLARMVEHAWSSAPGRVRVDTCTLDHPRALPNYQAAGFVPYGRSIRSFTIPY
jgi:GNAT superfamily N-acetyltransferase